MCDVKKTIIIRSAELLLLFQCYLCGRQIHLSALGNHLRLEHGITISKDIIFEFYNARTRYKALKYQIFGDDESSGSDSDNDLSLSKSALDRIQQMSNNFQNSLEGDQTIQAIKGETPKVSDYFKSILSPDDIHLAFDPSKRESPKPKRWDPIKSGNHGWLTSESNPESVLKFARDQKYVNPQLPWERSAATDRLFYEEITNQIFEVILEDVINVNLYDIAGLAIKDRGQRKIMNNSLMSFLKQIGGVFQKCTNMRMSFSNFEIFTFSDPNDLRSGRI